MSKTAVFFRTHFWDEHAAAAARLLQAQCAGADFRVLADESTRILPVPPELKLSHAAGEFDAMGLEPAGHSLWFNGDYPLYKALDSFPGHDHYVIAEFDVRTTVNLAELGETAFRRGIDLIAHDIRPAPPGWPRLDTCEGIYATPHIALIPLLLVSRRLATHLRRRRQELTASLQRGDIAQWPYCEAFVASEAMADSRFRVAQLSEFGDTRRFDWSPAMPERVMRSVAGGAFLHPVLDDARFIQSRLRTHDPYSFFDPDSTLSQQLEGCPGGMVAAALLPVFRRARDYPAVMRLRRMLGIGEAGAAPRASIAFAKPATQSSVSPYSCGTTPEADAGGGNDGVATGEYGFHTDFEDQPWWMVDLLRPYALERIRLFNRLGFEFRARRFSVLASLDGADWTTVLRKDDDSDFGGVGGAPFEARIAAPARFVKVALHGRDCLHLDQVELFGTSCAAA